MDANTTTLPGSEWVRVTTATNTSQMHPDHIKTMLNVMKCSLVKEFGDQDDAVRRYETGRLVD
jgi:hypothetical protein